MRAHSPSHNILSYAQIKKKESPGPHYLVLRTLAETSVGNENIETDSNVQTHLPGVCRNITPVCTNQA